MNQQQDPRISVMRQPEDLLSDEWQPWWQGKGTSVWKMLTSAITGDLHNIKQLLEQEPGLLHCSYRYYFPLYFAIRENHPQLVEFLLKNTPRPGSNPGRLPEIARERGNHAMADFVEKLLRELYDIRPEGETLASTIKQGNLPALQKMIKQQPSLIRAADSFGNKAIHWAVLTRQLPIIRFLLEHGADINAQRPDGARPLDLTNGDYYYRSWYRDLPPQSLQRHEVVAGYLIAYGASYDLSVAAKFGDTGRVRELLDADPSLVKKLPDYVSYYSGYALRNAAGAGHLATVQLLLERGADPNFPELDIAPRGGALHAAIGGHHRLIAQLLLEHGADPNAAVESSGNCMSRAKAFNAPPELINLLALYGGAQTVELLCYYNNLEELSQVFQSNPLLHVPPEALDAAIGEGHQLVVELLLRYQPDLLKKHSLGSISNINFARWLMKNGLNPNNADWLGITPLHRAASEGNIELAALCLEYGANIDAIESDYFSTPLGWAARKGQRSMAAFLLQEGADALAPKHIPWAQPAAWAERMGYEDIVLLLLD
ncbi:ankyrin repeat domain-containing protein [Pseudobacter ginsenosidimutans]|uniref:Ankyrin repeat protein n=1 Tax=Pseudobacter ginsenosidimutans TaxID=661488 RepID=A0A4Q7N2D6_9BACT|nr:ankyrin repeat domain-containing protein [Pseudobacter ginsenosidimutans]QEC43564.1 ankyrin repeat domain-containing protein [Pseudobacter ginsenosidimutans]RZS74959.1 ankyrin repeat protein [Pseudobacter ginsenosidimutans]